MSKFESTVSDALKNMRNVFPATPLQKNAFLSDKYGADIYLKREDLSPVRSYKIRGALNMMRKQMASGNSGAEFVCASAGNHAQGVAFACAHFDMKGQIFMPVTTPQQKITKTAVFGAGKVQITLTGDYFDETLVAAQNYSDAHNACFLPPFDHADVIEGQATVGLEIEQQLGRSPDIMVVPVGGGGLSAGLTKLAQEQGSKTKFHLVEPHGARSLWAALNAGAPVTLPTVDSFVDGASVATVGATNYDILQSISKDHVHEVSEDRLCATIYELLNIEGIVLEPAGALSVDVLKDLKDQVRGKTVVCIASGGNFDFERLPDIKERAMRFEGLKKYFILRMPQRPGALKDFLNLLGDDDDIARFEYLKKSARNFGTVLLGIETKEAKNFESLFQRMKHQGFAYQDITDDEILAQFLI